MHELSRLVASKPGVARVEIRCCMMYFSVVKAPHHTPAKKKKKRRKKKERNWHFICCNRTYNAYMSNFYKTVIVLVDSLQ